MTFTFKYSDRLELFATDVTPCVQHIFATYLRPFAEGEVRDGEGRVVAAIPPRLQQAQARLMAAVATFEKVAAELATQTKTDLAALKAYENADRLNEERHTRAEKEQS